MSGYDLMEELKSKNALLDQAYPAAKKRGIIRAEAEKKYKEELNKAILLEREKGTPVSILGDIVRGTPSIARLRFERDVADVTYKSAMEAINIYKLQIKILNEQIAREWGRD